MKFLGYVYGQSTIPIYEDEGFYYLSTEFCYVSLGNISFVNKKFKDMNLKIYKLS